MTEEEIIELKKQVSDLQQAVGYIAYHLDHFVRATGLEGKPKEYESINAFMGTIKCLVDKNHIQIGSSIDDCIKEIEDFTRRDAINNFPSGVPVLFPMYIDVFKNYIKNNPSESVRFNWYGCIPMESIQISFSNKVITKIDLHVKSNWKNLVEDLISKYAKNLKETPALL